MPTSTVMCAATVGCRLVALPTISRLTSLVCVADRTSVLSVSPDTTSRTVCAHIIVLSLRPDTDVCSHSSSKMSHTSASTSFRKAPISAQFDSERAHASILASQFVRHLVVCSLQKEQQLLSIGTISRHHQHCLTGWLPERTMTMSMYSLRANGGWSGPHELRTSPSYCSSASLSAVQLYWPALLLYFNVHVYNSKAL